MPEISGVYAQENFTETLDISCFEITSFAKPSKTKFPSISVIFMFASVTNPLIAIMPLYVSLTGLGKTLVVDCVVAPFVASDRKEISPFSVPINTSPFEGFIVIS